MVRRNVPQRSTAVRERAPRRGLAGLLVAATLAAAACGGDDGGSTTTPAASDAVTTIAPTAAPDTAAAAADSTVAPADGDTTTTAAATTTLVPPTTLAVTPAISDAVVTRSDDGGQLTISWRTDSGAPVGLTWGADPDAIDQTVDAAIEGATVTIDDPAPGARAFFRIGVGDETVTVAERRVVLEGVPNFRDLGGYATEDGRHVKWGQVYRSGALADLTEADLATVERIGIALVCDLRSDGEVAEDPDPDGVAAEQIRLAVNDETVDVAQLTAAITAGDLSSVSPTLLLEGMPVIATEFTDNWSQLLLRISDPANRPTNFHCTAGKDRAGWASAVVLRSLGVPEETVIEDYLLSNGNLAEKNAETVATVRAIVAGVQGVPEDEVDMTNLEALLEVRAEYLQAAFDAVDEKFGSFDAYLTNGLGLTEAQITALRDSMLE